jgi:hypothetical protein
MSAAKRGSRHGDAAASPSVCVPERLIPRERAHRKFDSISSPFVDESLGRISYGIPLAFRWPRKRLASCRKQRPNHVCKSGVWPSALGGLRIRETTNDRT